MMRFARFAFLFLALLAPALALAAPMQTGAAPARGGFFPAAEEIGQQLQELVTGDANMEIEPQETFGTRALGLLLTTAKFVGAQSADFFTNFAALPQLSVWLNQQMNDPTALDRWMQAGQLLVLALACAFAAGWAMDLLLLPLRRKIYRGTFETFAARLGGIFVWLLLSLFPVLAFVLVAATVTDLAEPTKFVRFIVMSFIYALALLRLLRVGLRFLLAPRVETLRLIPIATSQAVYLDRWASWYGGILLIGYYLVDVARIVKVPPAAISGFRSLLALVIVGMTIVVIHQKRSVVSTFLRGDLSAARAGQSLVGHLRLWFARTWHVLAISYLVIGYFVTMLGSVGGFLVMQQGTIGTLLVLLLMRFSFFASARLTYRKKGEEEAVSGIYRPVLRFLARLATWIFGALGILAAWGADVGAMVGSAWGQRILGSVFTITSTVLLLVFVYEFIHATIERRLNKHDAQGKPLEASSRARTILPMVRYAAILILSLVGGLVTLSEFGINTGPLLAGAGVLGVALGFGSQTLVKDFLTGLFIILEDTIAVGDIVKIGDNGGVVEGMTIRTARLRDVEGTLHILPYSEISSIANFSKNFAFALLDIGVAYESDLDKVMAVMRDVGEELRHDPSMQGRILEPIEIMGVENYGDSSITVRGRIKTKGGEQWNVKRAYLLRLKKRFDKEGIEIPYPHVSYVPKSVDNAIPQT